MRPRATGAAAGGAAAPGAHGTQSAAAPGATRSGETGGGPAAVVAALEAARAGRPVLVAARPREALAALERAVDWSLGADAPVLGAAEGGRDVRGAAAELAPVHEHDLALWAARHVADVAQLVVVEVAPLEQLATAPGHGTSSKGCGGCAARARW